LSGERKNMKDYGSILKGSWSNIRNVYDQTAIDIREEGEQWYPEANRMAQVVGSLTGLPSHKQVAAGAGILAALSPQTDWGNNLAWSLLAASEGTQKQTTANHNKAMRIRNGENPDEVLGGLKVRAFYHAILEPLNDHSPVTIDRHAVAIYLGKQPGADSGKAFSNKHVWKRIEGAYVRAAKKLEINHHALQAITWVEWRYRKGLATRIGVSADA
jgi:hypothetical protein